MHLAPPGGAAAAPLEHRHHQIAAALVARARQAGPDHALLVFRDDPLDPAIREDEGIARLVFGQLHRRRRRKGDAGRIAHVTFGVDRRDGDAPRGKIDMCAAIDVTIDPVLGIDRGHSDDIAIGARKHRKCGGAVIARRRNDHVAAPGDARDRARHSRIARAGEDVGDENLRARCRIGLGARHQMGHRGAVQTRLGDLAVEGALVQRDTFEMGKAGRDAGVDQSDLAAAGHALGRAGNLAALGLHRRTVEQVLPPY